MRIYKDVRFKGAKGGIIKQSLIDTGASINPVLGKELASMINRDGKNIPKISVNICKSGVCAISKRKEVLWQG
jgi:predicted aspartyl protease